MLYCRLLLLTAAKGLRLKACVNTEGSALQTASLCYHSSPFLPSHTASSLTLDAFPV